MKKPCGIVFLMIILIGLTSACGSSDVTDDTMDNLQRTLHDSFVMLDTEEWPQNEYTASIPQPGSGTVLWGWIDPDTYHCYIDMTGVSSEAMEDWYCSLLSDGFTELDKEDWLKRLTVSMYKSTNVLLHKDGVYISMTHLSTDEGNLGLCITRET